MEALVVAEVFVASVAVVVLVETEMGLLISTQKTLGTQFLIVLVRQILLRTKTVVSSLNLVEPRVHSIFTVLKIL